MNEFETKHYEEMLERLREAESILGSEVTETPPFTREGRLRWLKQTRELLHQAGVEPENLMGEWRTYASR